MLVGRRGGVFMEGSGTAYYPIRSGGRVPKAHYTRRDSGEALNFFESQKDKKIITVYSFVDYISFCQRGYKINF